MRADSFSGSHKENDMALFRFIYTSTACAPFGEAELLHLRLTGENQNDRHGVTGLLVFDGLRFAQLIEGPEAGLSHIIDRITRDPRHEQILVRYRGPTAERQFAGWALKARWKSAGAPSDNFIGEVQAAVASVSDRDVATAFVDFARAAA